MINMAMDINGIISIAIGVFIAAILLPIAFTQLYGVNTTSWSTTDQTLFGLIGTVAVLAIIVGMVYLVKRD
jgi:hypothetical protein